MKTLAPAREPSSPTRTRQVRSHGGKRKRKREQVLRGRKGGKKKKKRDKPDKLDINMAGRVSPLSFFFLFFSLLAIKREQVCESTVIAIILEKEERKKERNLIDFIFSIIWLLTWQARVEPRQGGHDVMKIWHCHRVHVGRFSLGGRHLRSWAWLKSGENDEFNYYNQNSIDLNTWYFAAEQLRRGCSASKLNYLKLCGFPC